MVTNAPLWKGAAALVKAGVATDLSASTPRGTLDTLSTRIVPEPVLVAPVKQGDVIGRVELLQGGKVLSQTKLVALENVEQGGFFRRLWDSIRLFFHGLFG